MRRVPLCFEPEGRWACLRELSGREESAVSGTATRDAVRLLDGLLVDLGDSSVGPGEAAGLVSADRDRLLAAVYLDTYGPRIESTVTCSGCESPFDLDFELDELVAFLGAQPLTADPAPGADPGLFDEFGPDGVERRPDGTFALDDGRRFRLPTGEDEMAVAGLPVENASRALLGRCVDGCGDETGDPVAHDAVQDVMESVAPVLDADLAGRCPECAESETFRFDLQRYLLSALLGEQGRLAEEIHLLATAYGWSLDEIFGLPRSQRRALVSLVEGRRKTAARRRPA